jgi:FkbM family methyltransferase
VDAVTDAMLNRFYDSNGVPLGQSVHQFQQLITEQVLYIKHGACSQSNNMHEECISEQVSNFVDSVSTHVEVSTGDDGIMKIFLRQGYSDEQIAECFSSKNKSSYRQYKSVLKEIKEFRNSGRPFLELLKSRGFSPRHVLDVGANIGEYAASISQQFPGADVFMIEACRDHEIFLHQLSSSDHIGTGAGYKSTRFRYEIAAVMDEVKNMTFYLENQPANFDPMHHNKATGNSLFRENTPHFENSATETVETATIDSIMAKHGITNIDFIKFDIQGAELYALRGAQKTLESVDVIQLEIHIAHLNANAPTFFELHSYMDSIGFAIRDQGQTFRVVRPHEMLVGMDFLWLRKTSFLWGEG